MRENFDACVAEVLRHEGGYVDDRRDPGGATNMGITRATLAAWRGKPVSKADVRSLTRAEAIRIYRARYWHAVSGDSLPSGLDMVAFDGCVNSGEDRSERWLQAAVGATVDGEIGPATIAKARSADAGTAINRALDNRLAFMRQARHGKTGALLWPTYGKGWQARVDRVRAFSLALASQRPAPKPGPAAPSPSIPAASAASTGGLWAWLKSLFGVTQNA